jgi:hypothetical protein
MKTSIYFSITSKKNSFPKIWPLGGVTRGKIIHHILRDNACTRPRLVGPYLDRTSLVKIQRINLGRVCGREKFTDECDPVAGTGNYNSLSSCHVLTFWNSKRACLQWSKRRSQKRDPER